MYNPTEKLIKTFKLTIKALPKMI